METVVKSGYDEFLELIYIPKVKQFDLSVFIDYHKHNPIKYRIGVLSKDIDSLTSYKKGDVVLFEMHDPKQCYGRNSIDEANRAMSRVTICIPSCLLFKDDDRNKYSTVKCMVWVPIDHIDYEIKL